ncbi:hypothetical protein U9M48_022840 [Paspalum notatum var. saurae]|uniref:C2 domain-containing protein n=1 Tax=Paspalum notatum var. saurae TaxID=547442 RepID=A0AAQ3WVA2_PASNO
MGQCVSWALGILLPSLWEAEVAISATALLIAALVLVLLTSEQQRATKPAAAAGTSSSPASRSSAAAACYRDAGRRRNGAAAAAAAAEIVSCAQDGGRYVVKLELLSAKYLIGANLDGSSDPFAVISCADQKRFSSMVPSQRNPLWGEEFNFLVDKLPVEVTITIYDWDTACKCKVTGSVTIAVLSEDETGACWYELDSKCGQICLCLCSTKAFPDSENFLEECTGDESPRKMMLNKQRQTMIEGIGPLQTIYKLPHDEIVHQSYSCALERCFLHHGRMYISQWHLCFHSNVFSKQLNTCTFVGDYSITRHRRGRIRYTFASFWSRNRTFRALEAALQSYEATLEAEKQKFFPGTPEKFFSTILGDNSMFFQQYRDARKDTDLKLSKWCVSQEHGGKVREVTFRSQCHSPLCPPDTAVTEWQHASFSKDKRSLIYETKHQAHDVPFGSYFEVFGVCYDPLQVVTKNNLQFDMPSKYKDWLVELYFHKIIYIIFLHIIGVNMKKWCILQSRIKSGATEEYRKEVCKILEAASDYFLKFESNNNDSDEIVMASSP